VFSHDGLTLWGSPKEHPLRTLLPLISLVLILAPSGAASPGISGAFETAHSVDLDTGDTSIDAQLTTSLSWPAWLVEFESEIDEGTWDLQSILAQAGQSPWSLRSTLRMEPDAMRLRDWKTELAYERESRALEIEHKLTRTRSWLTLELEKESLGTEIGARLRFRSSSCEPLCFYDLRFDVARTMCTSVEASARIEFDHEGLDELLVVLDGLTLRNLPWLKLEMEMERSVHGAVLEIDPTIDVGPQICFLLEMEAGAAGGGLTSIRIPECSLDCAFGAWDLEATALWDPDDWIDDIYCARLELEGEWDQSDRDLEARFVLHWRSAMAGSIHLSQVTALAAAELTPRLSGSLSLVVDLDDPTASRLELGLEGEWPPQT